jgi:hypothetical protein
MTTPKKPGGRSTAHKPRKSLLDGLTDAELASVLRHLLHSHPQLRDEAEFIARDLLSRVNQAEVARDVVAAINAVRLGDLQDRAGNYSRGYTAPTEAAWELFQEAIEPTQDEMVRYLRLGLDDQALATLRGAIAGLYKIKDRKDHEVLSWASDFPSDAAFCLLRLWACDGEPKPKEGIPMRPIPDGLLDELVPAWAPYLGDTVRRWK